MISADMQGRRVLVTGGASGIGLAAVEAFARCGARVAMNHLADDPRGERESARLAGDGLAVIAAPGDVSDPHDAGRMVEAAAAALGGLDVLVNNAGTANTVEPIPLEDLDAMTEEFWSAILSTNLIGPFRCSRAAAPYLRESRGSIVSTASIAGLGRPGSSVAYGASKAGLINLTKYLARALAPDVRVNAVAPGLVLSPWTESWPEARKRASIEQALLKRAVVPQDIADAMLYLSAAGAVTGQVLVVDCGMMV